MRDDALARALDEQRWAAIPPLYPAADFQRLGIPPASGRDVAAAYGLLVHYTQWQFVTLIMRAGEIGPRTWLTPTPYAACMVPYNLGLNSPREVCLLVDVSAIPVIWGPGLVPPSGHHPSIWRGGGIEFFVDSPIPFSAVREIVEIAPCGDEHA